MMLARLLSKIYKKNGIVLIDSQGQKYICGKPDLNKPVTLKLLKKNLNWKLIINPKIFKKIIKTWIEETDLNDDTKFND